MSACKSEPFQADTGVVEADQQLIVTARHYYSQNKDSLLPDVLVKLYKTADDRASDFDVQKYGNTDSTRTITFHYLKEAYYFVKAIHGMGEKLEEVSIPKSADISYLEIKYY